MNLLEVAQRLYESEINCGFQTFFDGGFELWLGDQQNGHKAGGYWDIGNMDKAAKWLDMAARRFYPKSKYAREREAEEGAG